VTSVNVELEPSDEKKVVKVLDNISPEKNKAIFRDSLRKAALLVQRIATQEMIVRGRGTNAEPLPTMLSNRTSTLIRSVALRFDPTEAQVGTDLNYGVFHETNKTKPRPFLSPALRKAEKKFAGLFRGVLETELNK